MADKIIISNGKIIRLDGSEDRLTIIAGRIVKDLSSAPPVGVSIPVIQHHRQQQGSN